MRTGKPTDKVEQQLQSNIAMYFDKDTTLTNINRSSGTGRKNRTNNAARSLVGRLKGKRGRIRGNIMGKRVNYSSRTVITPDASIDIDCLGVPKRIAVKQTVPEVVNRLNIDRLTKCVRLGSGVVGGASKVHMLDKKVCNLHLCSDKTRRELVLKRGMVVERHLQDDDWVVFNRQPTLHKESMMGHRVRIMEGLTFRLPVPDTTPYNADFDGDEMNMHTPQDLQTVAEVKELMSISSQILGPKSNRPTIGCVQDTVIGLYLLTQPDVFLEPAEFMRLSMACHYADSAEMPEPAVLKPRRL